MFETAADSDSLVFRLARFVSFFVVIQLTMVPILFDLFSTMNVEELYGIPHSSIYSLVILMTIVLEQRRPMIDTDTVWKCFLTTGVVYYFLQLTTRIVLLPDSEIQYHPFFISIVLVVAVSVGASISRVRIRTMMGRLR